ncbi:MAG TPA: rhodanese-like domain-containing protein [Candidatus Omnitrophota bacterium]|nr:rhodanese-like domain-containing protein [Candidatus Omnitrophota bacterium]
MTLGFRLGWIGMLVLGAALVPANRTLAGGDSSAVAAVAASAGAAAASAKDTTPTKADLVQPAELAKDLALPEWRRPVLLHVGFSVLYKSGHIPGSKYVGSGSTARGRAELKKALKAIPKDRSVVLYCGCCPWEHCPNVNPAFRVARGLGYKNVKILYILQDLQRDWVDKGYPALES